MERDPTRPLIPYGGSSARKQLLELQALALEGKITVTAIETTEGTRFETDAAWRRRTGETLTITKDQVMVADLDLARAIARRTQELLNVAAIPDLRALKTDIEQHR